MGKEAILYTLSTYMGVKLYFSIFRGEVVVKGAGRVSVFLLCGDLGCHQNPYEPTVYKLSDYMTYNWV